jgi:hypothetical protein
MTEQSVMMSVIQPAEVWKLYFDCPLNVSAVVVSAYVFLKLTLAGPCIIIQFKQINQPDATVLQVYYLTFCVSQHVSGAPKPIIRSLQLH